VKLVLHVGPPKTGTTAIQGALIQNRKALLEAGALYFIDETEPAWALPMMFLRKQKMHPALRQHFWSLKQARAWSERAWIQLGNQIERHRPHTVILSSEHFVEPRMDFDGLQARLREVSEDIHVVAYLRDPASHYCSVIDQHIRGGMRLDDLQTPWSYEYPQVRLLSRYHTLYGPERMTVQSFDRRHLRDGDIVADFQQVLTGTLGLDLPPLSYRGAPNTALSGAAAALLAVMNETFVRIRTDNGDRAMIKRRAEAMARLRQSPTLAALPRLALHDEALKATIRHNAREPLDWANATFFGGRPVMDTGHPGAPAPDEAAQRAFMKDWLLGYLDGETARLAAQEVIG
jgi:hypothetical protein